MTQADTRHGPRGHHPTPFASGRQRLMKPGWDVAPLPEACDTPRHRPHGSGAVTPLPSRLPPPWENREKRDARIPQDGSGDQEQHGHGTVVTITSKDTAPGVPLTPPWALNATKYHHFPPPSSNFINTAIPEMSPYLQGSPPAPSTGFRSFLPHTPQGWKWHLVTG